MEVTESYAVEIVRTARKKTITVKIELGKVKVVVPKGLSDERIQEVVRKYRRWIEGQIKKQAELVIPDPKTYTDGERFQYLGRDYRLSLAPVMGGAIGKPDASVIKLKRGRFQLGYPAELSREAQRNYIQAAFIAWYKHSALKHLQKRTRHYQKILGVTANLVRIKDYKARWGSCSASKEIFYNWRIIMAPPDVVNYLVVHELCHLIEYNHSQAFWRHVAGVIPDYKQKKSWLKKHSLELYVLSIKTKSSR